ncbi:hypothetical protein [Acidithiobacillus ferrooxidans]|uniref:hypothetical protein n=1 Tax=Acidithiobacillus ferrooxidans TaxID=920 RepID=UPI000B0A858A|nr:hypothetical protein [Acidithiobacillus ferrooxidans]
MSTRLQRWLQGILDNTTYSRHRVLSACERFTLRVHLVIFEITWLLIVGLYCFSVSRFILFAQAAAIEIFVVGVVYGVISSGF